MKKRILLAISVLLILGLSIAVFAYTKSATVTQTPTCCKNGVCPMKTKGAKMDDCCDMPDCCCKKGDACPMKNHDK